MNHDDIIRDALARIPALTLDEAHAVFGLTTTLFYRGFNQDLSAGRLQAQPLHRLITSALGKLPRANGPQQIDLLLGPLAHARIRDSLRLGSTLTSGYWTSRPTTPSLLEPSIRLVLRTSRARDISPLSALLNFPFGRQRIDGETQTLIPFGVLFAVVAEHGNQWLLEEVSAELSDRPSPIEPFSASAASLRAEFTAQTTAQRIDGWIRELVHLRRSCGDFGLLEDSVFMPELLPMMQSIDPEIDQHLATVIRGLALFEQCNVPDLTLSFSTRTGVPVSKLR